MPEGVNKILLDDVECVYWEDSAPNSSNNTLQPVYKFTGKLIFVKGEVKFMSTRTATPKTINFIIVYIGLFSNKENTNIKTQ